MQNHVITNNQLDIVETWEYPDDKPSMEYWLLQPENESLLKMASDAYAAVLAKYPDLKIMDNPPNATDTAIDIFFQWVAYVGAKKVLKNNHLL